MGKSSVYGMLFLENENKVKVVEVEVENKSIVEDDYLNEYCFDYPVLRPIFGQTATKKSLFLIERENNEPYGAELHYRDDLNGGSKQNTLVLKATNRVNLHDWRGPLLILKAINLPACIGYNGSVDPDYIDIELRDMKDVISFFKNYGKSK
jgi:hypothetical protein